MLVARNGLVIMILSLILFVLHFAETPKMINAIYTTITLRVWCVLITTSDNARHTIDGIMLVDILINEMTPLIRSPTSLIELGVTPIRRDY